MSSLREVHVLADRDGLAHRRRRPHTADADAYLAAEGVTARAAWPRVVRGAARR